jgi:fumarate hydratase subunit alpha
MLSEELIKKATVQLLRMASTKPPPDVKEALEKAYENENDQVPRMQLRAILDNMKLAEEKGKPICQDTGIPIFYVSIGEESIKGIDIERAIKEGVREATGLIPLRPNVVDVLTRENPGTNVGERMPYINYRFTENEYLEIFVLPKGAGSENMSSFKMLTPSQGIRGIKEFVLDTVVKAGGKPCPPIILGIGIGGSADISMEFAKEALLRPINRRHQDERIAELERELYNAINETGIGPMGLGGKTTLLGVNIEYASCHTASLPVAINVQCWAARRAKARIYPDARVEYIL